VAVRGRDVDSGLVGKVVVITGGAGGIGKACARRFLEEQATVFIADISPDGLEAAVKELSGVSSSVYPIRADVSRVEDCERLVSTVVGVAVALDVLVNTAGLWTEGPSHEVTEEQWDRVVDVNLKGTFFCCRYAIPELKKTRGCIVNFSSDAGLVGTPETAVYSASKGGVTLLTKVLAIELAPDLVRVNAVCPADVMSPMLEGQARDFGGDDPEAYFRTLLSCYPQGGNARFIRPEEVAELVVYLCSRAAAPVTGAALSIDFGTTAGYGFG
jgi:NAD(P)-dependent dehydrogenase (short-subunit alcohol dehydrogenase family)